MLLILSVLAGLLILSLRKSENIRSYALSLEQQEETRYENKLQPTDLIELSLYLREWFPRKK